MFWDSSAIVPLLIIESRSSDMASILRSDAELTMWWASSVECQSAIYRGHREAPIPHAQLQESLERLEGLYDDADVVPASEDLRQRAGRVLALHPLRAADALQLAAALLWSEEQPAGESFVCLDERLREAARREGFTVLPA